MLPVCVIVIMDFTLMDDDETDGEQINYLRRIQLADVNTKKVFYKDLTFVYIELARFDRILDDATPADKWIYLLKNLPELQDIPAELAEDPFPQVFAMAEEAALSPDERYWYEGSLKVARDQYSQLKFAATEGRAEGRAEGRIEGIQEGRTTQAVEMARALLEQGVDPTAILALPGVDETILKLAQS